jgi:hypothetical protein
MGIPVSLRASRNVFLAAILAAGCGGAAEAQRHGGPTAGGGHAGGGPFSSGNHAPSTPATHVHHSSGGGSGKGPLGTGEITPLALRAQPVLLPTVFPEHLRDPFPRPKPGGGNQGGKNPSRCGPGAAALPGRGAPSCGGIVPREPYLDFAATSAASCEYILVLKDGRTFCIKNYWLDGDRLYFTTFNGSVGSAPSSLFEEVRAANLGRGRSLF